MRQKSNTAKGSMLAQERVLRATQPPAVRVPTLETSPKFTGSGMFCSNLHERQMQGGTLSDHYLPRQQAGAGHQRHSHADPLEVLEAAAGTVRIDELLRGIRATSTAAATSLAEKSPPPRHVTPSYRRVHTGGDQRRSASPDRVPTAQSTPTRGGARGESPARPAWNQNRPTPRAKPTVSAPRTQPRRLARDASVDRRSRPWLEGMKRASGAQGRLSTEKEDSTPTNKITSTTQRQASCAMPRLARKSSPIGVTMSPVSVARGRKAFTEKDETLVQPRLGLLERTLQETQQRAVKAEARCEELEVSLQALTLEHRETVSRLEERHLQMEAQLQYVLQWIEHFDSTRVEREVFAECIEAEGDRSAEVSQTFLDNQDVFDTPCLNTGRGSADSSGVEIPVKATPVRVPPAPPMTLQIQNR